MREMTSRRFVKQVMLLIVGVVALAWIAWFLPKTSGQEKDTEPDRIKWMKFVEESRTERVSGRRNGVLLRTEVNYKTTEADGIVLFHWSIDYNGPRQPLTIWKPHMFTRPGCYATFLAIDGNEKMYAVDVFPRYWGGGPGGPEPKSDYITVKKNEVGKGTIEVSSTRIGAAFRKKYPKEFKEDMPVSLFGQLQFSPTMRGEHYDLDAWTGDLKTELKMVEGVNYLGID